MTLSGGGVTDVLKLFFIMGSQVPDYYVLKRSSSPFQLSSDEYGFEFIEMTHCEIKKTKTQKTHQKTHTSHISNHFTKWENNIVFKISIGYTNLDIRHIQSRPGNIVCLSSSPLMSTW